MHHCFTSHSRALDPALPTLTNGYQGNCFLAYNPPVGRRHRSIRQCHEYGLRHQYITLSHMTSRSARQATGASNRLARQQQHRKPRLP